MYGSRDMAIWNQANAWLMFNAIYVYYLKNATIVAYAGLRVKCFEK